MQLTAVNREDVQKGATRAKIVNVTVKGTRQKSVMPQKRRKSKILQVRKSLKLAYSVADPGFPVGGGVDLVGGGGTPEAVTF